MSEFRDFVQNLVNGYQKELVTADVDAILGDRYVNHKGVDELIREHNEKKAYSSSKYRKAVGYVQKRACQGKEYRDIQLENRWNSAKTRKEQAEREQLLAIGDNIFDLHLGFDENSHPQATIRDNFGSPKGTYLPKINYGSKWHDNGKTKTYVNMMRVVSYRLYHDFCLIEFRDTDAEFVEHWTRVKDENNGYSQWLIFRNVPYLKDGSVNPYDGFAQLRDFLLNQKVVYQNVSKRIGERCDLDEMLTLILGEVVDLPKFERFDFSKRCDRFTVFGYFGDINELDDFFNDLDSCKYESVTEFYSLKGTGDDKFINPIHF